MKKCCGLCPYSRKNTLYIHPDRALDFGYSAENPYTDFVCHKTGVTIEDGPEEFHGNIVRAEKSLTCAGFYAMQSLINGREDTGDFELDYDDHFSDPHEMEEHHADEYYKTHKE